MSRFVYFGSFIIALLLPGLAEVVALKIFTRTDDSVYAEDLDFLLKNVTDIYMSGIPGFISVYGPTAFTVLVGQMGTSGVYHPVVAASRLGKGKLMGMTHDQLMDPEMDPIVSNKNEFILNSVRWTSQNEAPTVAVIKSDVGDTLVSFLTNNSLPAIRIPSKELTSVEQLRNFDVVVVKEFFNTSLVPIFKEYANDGGGLIMTLTSWATYIYMNVPGHFGANFPANIISSKVGFVWREDGYSDATAPNGRYNASTIYLQNTRVPEAWEEIKKILNTGYPDDPETKLQQYSSILDSGFQVIPPGDSFWDDDFYNDALNFTQVGGQPVPSKSDPVTEDMHKFELQVFYALSTYVLHPEDVSVHPGNSEFPGAISTKSCRDYTEEVTIKYKKPSWFQEYTRSTKDPWSYVPNSINTCHPGKTSKLLRNEREQDEAIELSTKLPLWFSTGKYAQAGQVIKVTLETEDMLDSFKVQIGSHTDDVSHHPEWFRSPRITTSKYFVNNTASIASPYGGLIYIIIPEEEIFEKEKTIQVAITGSTPAPFFRLGTTQKHDWTHKIRQEPGPWTEFVTDNIILTVPSTSIRNLEDPEDLLLFWDQVMDAIADLSAIPRERYRQERMVPDIEISAGFMHSAYPIMTFLNEGNMAVNVSLLRTEGSWGHFHELGHNHQVSEWTFDGTGEVTCNLFALYVMNTVCGIPTIKTRAEMTPEVYKPAVSMYILGGLDFNTWKSEPFLALMFYVQLQRNYGWTAYKQVFAKYRELADSERPVTEQQKIDAWLIIFSTIVEQNLSPFFQSWGFPISEEASGAVSNYPVSYMSIFDLLQDEL